MAKKQFIRHLEFYGFPDQNGYSSEINGVDLSDIREKNKEQDEEIQDLEGEKADKKDLIALSGTVENFITRQSEINQEFANAISGMSGDIEELKAIDTEFAEQLSAVTSGVDEAMDAIDILGDRVEDVEDSISGLSDAIESITEDYAKKEDVYSKEEIDEMISSGFSGYATQEWVEEQGYITEEEADARYAKIEDLEELSGAVESAATDIDGRLEEINDSIDDVNDKVDGLAEDLSAFSEDVASALSEVNDEISGITDDISELENAVSGNTEEIARLNELVTENTTAINNLDDKIDNAVSALTENIQEVRDGLDNKADKEDIENLENKKADKEDLDFVSGAVGSLDVKVNTEIARSTSADTAMQGKIDELDADVQETVETVESYGDRIDEVERGLAKEIIDRQNGDIALIGTSSDDTDEDTIWAAKNLAEQYKGEAISSAKTYTDNKISVVNGQIQNLENRIDQKLTHYATEAFVISACNDTEIEVRNEFTTAINNETQRAERAETNIEVGMQSLSAQVLTNINNISFNASRLNAITRWDGTDPEQYDDSGNGILDVLHREFHEFEKTHGTIKSIEFADGNLIITYITVDGEKQTIIPVSELIVLDDYYKKEETDALLDEKLDVSAYTDISDQVSANTENIEALSGDVVNLDSALAALIEKLGYKNNETLVTNGEYEVAFGEYNISNTSEDPSGQTIFSIGNGTDGENRSNAVEVRKNGDLYLWVEGEFMNVNKLLGQIAHEVYDNDTAHNAHFFDGD